MHKIIQSHLIIESHIACVSRVFLSLVSVLPSPFFSSLSLTLLDVLGFANGHDKTVYKTQSHSFSKLLIVTVIFTASS